MPTTPVPALSPFASPSAQGGAGTDVPAFAAAGADDADLDRRFGGLARLYGPQAGARLQAARVAVVGLGGVGSWTAEALARCGVGALTLVDLDQVSESNVNRQLHALSGTLGQAKVDAMAERVRGINPACDVRRIDDFVAPDNAAQLLDAGLDVIVDCADQAAAKIAMILLARERGQGLVVCGGAGGKTDPLALRAGDLSQASHDALLAKLRNTLRRHHGYPRPSQRAGKPHGRIPRMGVRALWIDQQAILPQAWLAGREAEDAVGAQVPAPAPQGLSCAGYGSVVMVTAAMGMAAANEAVRHILAAG